MKIIRPAASVLLSILFFKSQTFAQKDTTKQLQAKRVTGKIIIDGNLNEADWKTAPLATSFVQLRPTPFKKESTENRTEVYFLYDNDGVYIGGYCHEKNKDSISSELVGRDGFGNNDFIGIIFDTYKDKLNAFEYFVTPLGEQFDAKTSPNTNGNNEDFSWNAVWKNASKIENDGWSFEIFIPLSAIRFSTKPVQDWGLNIVRKRQKSGEQSFWNTIDPNKNGFLTQEGFWNGLENIKPPVRLQFSPYISTYINHFPYNDPSIKNTTTGFNGGMDVKYGLNQAMTLDMTLIPDFGQVQSDNHVLNLSPFEVKYKENRPFFTEGTDLFGKGNLFYSRRIGSEPIHRYDVTNQLASNEHIVENPGESKLLNATKISGRNSHNLGIGIFNAVTNTMYATVEDDKGHQRKIETNPLTNYNIVVLDQSLKHNSSVSFINTNVTRSGTEYDANVTAVLFDFNNKKNTYEWTGKVATSNIYGNQGKGISGYSHNVSFGKTSGNFNFNIAEELVNDKYNINDMGILFNNNYLDHMVYLGYHWNKPSKWYNRINWNNNIYYSMRLKSSEYQNANFQMNVNGQLKNQAFFFVAAWYEPVGKDFYEPRTEGRFFRSTEAKGMEIIYNSNESKKYSFFVDLLHGIRTLEDGRRYEVNFNNNFRFNTKFSIGTQFFYSLLNNSVGFADNMGSEIIFGRRKINTIENVLSFKYNFNTKMGITTRVRHYWSKVNYNQYYTLLADGNLAKTQAYTGNANGNYNSFNIDAVYTWQVAPGSFFNVVWKTAGDNFNNNVTDSYTRNFSETLKAPQNNNLSVKLIYFIDYLDLKKKKK